MPLRKRTQDHCKTLPSNAQAEDAEDTKRAERDSVRAPAVERPIAIDLSEPTEYDDGGATPKPRRVLRVEIVGQSRPRKRRPCHTHASHLAKRMRQAVFTTLGMGSMAYSLWHLLRAG